MPFRLRSQLRTAVRLARTLPWLVLFCVMLLACSDSDAPPGRILIRNDILDSSYNEVTVDQVATRAGPIGFRKTLKPGKRILLPGTGITRMRFSRKYKDYIAVYHVICPENKNDGVTIKLIDVHTGRMQGGCSLTKKGRVVGGVTQWEELSTGR